MSLILVVVSTDHSDSEEAVRSVSAGLKRGGYDVLNYVLDSSHQDFLRSHAAAIIEACEPEVNPNGNRH